MRTYLLSLLLVFVAIQYPASASITQRVAGEVVEASLMENGAVLLFVKTDQQYVPVICGVHESCVLAYEAVADPDLAIYVVVRGSVVRGILRVTQLERSVVIDPDMD